MDGPSGCGTLTTGQACQPPRLKAFPLETGAGDPRRRSAGAGGRSPRGSGGCKPPAEEAHRAGRDALGALFAPLRGAVIGGEATHTDL